MKAAARSSITRPRGLANDRPPARDVAAKARRWPGREIPARFRLRLIVLISAVFLGTMTLFLTVSYMSEKRLHLGQTFDHLDETLGVLAVTLRQPKEPSTSGLSELEESLTQRTGVGHRIVITDFRGRILNAATDELVGKFIAPAFGLHLVELRFDDGSSRRHTSDRWLASSAAALDRDSGTTIFLMRLRAGSEQFIQRFIGIHGLHIAVTLVAFLGVVQLIGIRYVKRPVLRLASHIRRVETGDFRRIQTPGHNDEFGWLANRFTEMATRLQLAVRRLVRAEKYASVAVVTYRIARELTEPLQTLNRHILYLEGIPGEDEDLQSVVSSLRRDRESIVGVIKKLQDIQPPEELASRG